MCWRQVFRTIFDVTDLTVVIDVYVHGVTDSTVVIGTKIDSTVADV